MTCQTLLGGIKMGSESTLIKIPVKAGWAPEGGRGDRGIESTPQAKNSIIIRYYRKSKGREVDKEQWEFKQKYEEGGHIGR